MLTSSDSTYLVIGYGNTLRSDDGAGYLIAETVANWNLAHVQSLALHQLTPDLAEPIAHSQVVIFVDAVAKPVNTPAAIVLEQLEPNYATTFTGHYADPRSLLSLTYTLYETSPIAYRLLIPAINFSFGESLSAVTQASMSLALAKIEQLLCVSCVAEKPLKPYC
ncbi:hydrogenase maturation protease [Pantanalinema sp. GBBB05]|uniref:hydrogenase maturation protease n=1 Tax=Pantanalinema sp. GBBB05 TaxID=2604139 RepID=UPI003D812CCA